MHHLLLLLPVPPSALLLSPGLCTWPSSTHKPTLLSVPLIPAGAPRPESLHAPTYKGNDLVIPTNFSYGWEKQKIYRIGKRQKEASLAATGPPLHTRCPFPALPSSRLSPAPTRSGVRPASPPPRSAGTRKPPRPAETSRQQGQPVARAAANPHPSPGAAAAHPPANAATPPWRDPRPAGASGRGDKRRQGSASGCGAVRKGQQLHFRRAMNALPHSSFRWSGARSHFRVGSVLVIGVVTSRSGTTAPPPPSGGGCAARLCCWGGLF